METKQSNNNAGFHPPDHERWTSETSQDLRADQTSETPKASGQNANHQNHNTGAQQKLQSRTEKPAQTLLTMTAVVCTLFFWWSPRFSWLSGSGQSLYSPLRGEQLDRFDRDTCLGVGGSMNDELAPFMAATFPTVELLLSFWRPLSEFLPEQSSLFTERTRL